MIIQLWALCQGEQHMVTMHVFAMTGIRCHTQYLARSVTLDTAVSLPRTSRIIENTEDMLRESWIRGCSASRTIPSAGLQDYEDTRWKTSSRVRKDLSLAWKAS